MTRYRRLRTWIRLAALAGSLGTVLIVDALAGIEEPKPTPTPTPWPVASMNVAERWGRMELLEPGEAR